MRYQILLLPGALEDIARMGQKRGKDFKAQVIKAITLLGDNLQHPGLRVHAIRGWDGWREAYINQGDRLIFKVVDETVVIAWCGSHEELDKQEFSRSLKKANSEA